MNSCVCDVCDETPESRVDLLRYVWKEMESKDVKSNIGMYNTLLKNLVYYRLPFEPGDFLKEMKGVRAKHTTYSLLIQAYAIRGDTEAISQLIKRIGGDIRYNTQDYGWLMHAHIRNGHPQTADKILKELTEKVKPDVWMYEPLIKAHAELGDIENVAATILCMDESDVYPTSGSYYLGMLHSMAIG